MLRKSLIHGYLRDRVKYRRGNAVGRPNSCPRANRAVSRRLADHLHHLPLRLQVAEGGEAAFQVVPNRCRRPNDSIVDDSLLDDRRRGHGIIAISRSHPSTNRAGSNARRQTAERHVGLSQPIYRNSDLRSGRRLIIDDLIGMAEKMGFEPTIPSLVYSLSRGAPSTTRPPLRCGPDRAIHLSTQALFHLRACSPYIKTARSSREGEPDSRLAVPIKPGAV